MFTITRMYQSSPRSLISLLRDTALFMKSVAVVVTITFSMLVLSPTAIAARAELEKRNQSSRHSTPEADLTEVYQKITEKLDKIEVHRAKGKDTQKLIKDIKTLRADIDNLDAEVMANFEALEADLKNKNLPDKILQRHDDMVQHYIASRNDFARQLDDLDKTAVEAFVDHWLHEAKVWLGEAPEPVKSPFKDRKDINTRQFKRSQQPFDPNNLPFKSMRPAKDNKPKKRKQDFKQAGLFNTPVIQVADLGDFTYDKLPGASDPAYLSETDEVLLTQPIKDQAQALDYDPVKIYHWVRNNVEWQPTWGAVQDAELTLDARRGNAMDIASLTIALLRASQIPARYAHGTIEVPIDKFNNWAGGFTSSDAAVDYAASGGIPTAAVIKGGQIDSVELEHIWVEAAIDYIPSRGAKNRDADSWVAMDPSYKQYEYLEGLDAVEISGIDTEQLANNFINSGTINEAEGWISGFDPTILEAAQQQAQTALEDHITNNIPDPTVGDVIGGRQIISFEAPVLASGLPYHVLLDGVTYDHLPEQLQQTVTYSLGRDELNQPINPTTFAWSTLNNEKVTLSFRPATAEDEEALLSLLPEGEITDISQLPQSIPSYLIEVIPEFKVNGELKIAGNPMALGEELVFNTTITFPGRSKQENYDYNVIAGSYLSVNVVAGSVSFQKLTELSASLNVTKSTLEGNDEVQIAALGRQKILGDMFYTGTLGYFSQLLASTYIYSPGNKSHSILASGYGTFGYEPKVNHLFGFPASIQAGGVVLDIPLSITSAYRDGNAQRKREFVKQLGTLSSVLEHTIPELIFHDPDNPDTPLEAISAVKAMQIAVSEGQRIYQITQKNISNVLPLLNLGSGIESEILASVGAGFVVTTHTDPVNVPGYTGAGYIIIDPVAGDGAYKISSGRNGSFIIGIMIGNALQMLPVLLAVGATPIGLAGILAAFTQLALALSLLITYQSSIKVECVALGMVAVGATTLVVGAVLGAIAAILGTLTSVGVAVGGFVADLMTIKSISEATADPSSVDCF